MPAPEDLHVDAVLSNVSVMYRNEEYIADRLFPQVPVKKDEGKYYLYTKDNLRLVETERADRADAHEGTYGILGNDSYDCVEHALKDYVTDRMRDNADDPLDPDIDATLALTDLLMISREYDLMTLLTTTGNYNSSNYTTLSGTSQWSDYANSDPIGNVRTAVDAVLLACNHRPNIFWCGWQVWQKLIDHPDILERTKYIGKDPTYERIAEIFGVDECVVGKGVYNASVEGQSDDNTFLWGKDAGVMYRPARPGIRTAACGYTLVSKPFQVRTYAVDSKGEGGTAIEPFWRWDHKVISVDDLSNKDIIAGYLIDAVIA